MTKVSATPDNMKFSEKMLEVFKTDVKEISEAEKLSALLSQHFPDSKISFDLEDCDKVLRMEGEGLVTQKVIMILNDQSFRCEVLD